MKRIVLCISFIFLFIIFSQFLVTCEGKTLQNQEIEIRSEEPSINKNAQLEVGQSQRYIDIKRDLVPKKNSYLLNEDILVFVEIKMLKFRDMDEKIDNAIIYELVDKDLNLKNKSEKGYIIYNLSDLNELKYNLSFKNITSPYCDIKWNKNLATLTVNNLNPWARTVYWYNITPKKAGTYKINTIVRSKYFSDIELPLAIDVSTSGLYDVSIVTSKNDIVQNEKLDVTFGITYLGNGQDNAIIKMECPPNAPFIILNNHNNSTIIKHSFNKLETFLQNVTIKYPKTGTYYVPGIWVDESYYSEDKTITVESFFAKYWQIIQFFIVMGSIVTGILVFIKYSIEIRGLQLDENLGLIKLTLKMISDIVNIIERIPHWIMLIVSTSLIASMLSFIILPLFFDYFISIDVLVVDSWIYLASIFILILIVIIGYSLYLNLTKDDRRITVELLPLAMILFIVWLIIFAIINNIYQNP
jgi:hypothetical protein